MPLPIQFDWSEDEHTITFVLRQKGVTAKNVDIALCDVYIKVNCHPALFDADLKHEIDPEHKKTLCKIGNGKVTLTLQKKAPGLWNDFRATGTKAELRERRQAALTAAQEREQERLKEKDDWREKKLKAGEHEQWRLDRENREQIEKWQEEEKKKWEDDFYSGFDEETGMLKEDQSSPLDNLEDGDGRTEVDTAASAAAATPSPQGTAKVLAPPREVSSREPRVVEVTDEEAEQIRAEKAKPEISGVDSAFRDIAKAEIWSEKDIRAQDKRKNIGTSPEDEEYEEYTPDVRGNPGKIGIHFSERQRAGVPVRDRGRRAPPFPKKQVQNEAPAVPMVEGDEPDEADPVWLKDKGDALVASGDYQGAYNAYTEALKLGTNARCFANRAVTALYLGNFEQSIEDGTRSLTILDVRNKVPDGNIAPPEDPEDQLVRARVHVRIGTAYLWLGHFSKAEDHFTKALAVQDGLEPEDRKSVKQDLEKVQQARAALVLKEKADAVARRAVGGGDREKQLLDSALGLYDEAASADSESAIVYANRCFAQLRAGRYQECLDDADTALRHLKRWPTARKAPKPPARPARLDPPYCEDPTFKHPDEKPDADWLMKHGGGSSENLPPLPPEYEWVRDTAEKDPNAWIAIRKKMSKAVIDAIKRATSELQDVVYTRKPHLIREQVKVAIEQNRTGEGPGAKAIRQAEEYADKLEAYEKEKQAARDQDEDELRRQFEEADLDTDLAANRSGLAECGFARGHPVEVTRRRLYVKVRLRRARALELMGNLPEAASELRLVLRAEPGNVEAKRRLSDVDRLVAPLPVAPPAEELAALKKEAEAAAAVAAAEPVAVENGGDGSGVPAVASSTPPAARKPAPSAAKKAAAVAHEDDVDAEDDEPEQDRASIESLLGAAAEYMKKTDYTSALQIYNYARRQSAAALRAVPALELKALSNTTLCLQRLRGRLPELVSACNEALNRIDDIREEATRKNEVVIPEETLLRMECAVLSRRGSAYSQQRKIEESNRDAARVRELVAKLPEEKTTPS
eukprot:gnl/TRDRNA2_/TRDRNA2_178347_c0_seq1.p1 gnl/TRDRNA2_/TRDRNA2_178347_c0~~gnl/TRDRNA2_/TRDRNA2_178347_c0_seq1.p1  ORF type:complete len:1030 (+),score=275.76 gnl/TRDRNA2_/TRDRNA2_178347_c0_seq1:60-3149(+)